MSIKKSRFDLGQYVSVKATCELLYDEKKQRFIKRIECSPFQGYIVGARYRLLGEYHPERGPGRGFEEGYEQAFLAVSGSVLIWLVSRGMINKPVEVLNDDIEICSDIHPPTPWRWVSPLSKEEIISK